jgi:hypothetical protein
MRRHRQSHRPQSSAIRKRVESIAIFRKKLTFVRQELRNVTGDDHTESAIQVLDQGLAVERSDFALMATIAHRYPAISPMSRQVRSGFLAYSP